MTINEVGKTVRSGLTSQPAFFTLIVLNIVMLGAIYVLLEQHSGRDEGSMSSLVRNNHTLLEINRSKIDQILQRCWTR
jgi:hypothetical protein